MFYISPTIQISISSAVSRHAMSSDFGWQPTNPVRVKRFGRPTAKSVHISRAHAERVSVESRHPSGSAQGEVVGCYLGAPPRVSLGVLTALVWYVPFSPVASGLQRGRALLNDL